MSKLARLVEAERRGILSGRQRELLLEARRRGLIAEPRDKVAEAIAQASSNSEKLLNAVAQMLGKDVAVHVPEQPAPVINVKPQIKSEPVIVVKNVPWRFEFEHDRNGRPVAITAYPIEA